MVSNIVYLCLSLAALFGVAYWAKAKKTKPSIGVSACTMLFLEAVKNILWIILRARQSLSAVTASMDWLKIVEALREVALIAFLTCCLFALWKESDDTKKEREHMGGN